MSRLLINEPPLQVLPSLAKEIGLNEAIMLQQMHYWLLKSANEFTGVKWFYKTLEEWQTEFPFWSAMTIRRTLGSLEKQKIIKIGNFNKNKFDKLSVKIFLKDQYIINLNKKESCVKLLKSCRENNKDLYEKVFKRVPMGIDIYSIVEEEIDNFEK